MRIFGILCSLFLFLVVPLSFAQTFVSGTHPPVVIELYTSEGCSSCPPAERWLNRFTEHSSLWSGYVPIAWHVDYWDYIGWPDRYAKPGHSVRQRRYKRETPLTSVYTPGVLVNGGAWRGWRHGDVPVVAVGEVVGVLRVVLEGEEFTAEFTPAEGQEGREWVLSVALLGFGLTTEVRRGENAGKELAHDFVVLASKRLGARRGYWSGGFPDAGRFGNGVKKLAAVFWLERVDSPQPVLATGGWIPRH